MSKSTKQNLLLALLLTIITLGGIYVYQVKRYNKFVQTVNNSDIVEIRQVTVTGVITCLPHKDMSGPITLECAFGMKDSQGNHYALNDPSMHTTPFLSSEDPITVTGTLSPDPDSKYDIVGVIEVESVTQ